MINFQKQNLLFDDFLKTKKTKMFLFFSFIQEKEKDDAEDLFIFGIFGEKEKMIKVSREFIFKKINDFSHQKIKEKDLFYFINFLSFKKEDFLNFLKEKNIKIELNDDINDLLFDFFENNQNTKTILSSI